MIFGIQNVRCTIAAEERFTALGACYDKQYFGDSDPLWNYFKCKHPDEGYLGQQMHSYVYIGGEFVGNGFALLADPRDGRLGPHPCLDDAHLRAQITAAGGDLSCKADCAASSGVLPQKLAELNRALEERSPVVLYGWAGCPCTNIARNRFRELDLCYVEEVWPERTAGIFDYLQCVYGKQHHSFVWIGGKFQGNGFGFDVKVRI